MNPTDEYIAAQDPATHSGLTAIRGTIHSSIPKAEEIKGTVCGVRVETIEDPLEKKMRQLDKLVDELSKGKPMEKVLR